MEDDGTYVAGGGGAYVCVGVGGMDPKLDEDAGVFEEWATE